MSTPSPSRSSLFLCRSSRALASAVLGAMSLAAQAFDSVELRPMSTQGTRPADAVVADFDRDGRPDCLAVSLSWLFVMRAVGDASAPAPQAIPLTNTFFVSTIQVVDSSLDGWPDLWIGHGAGLQERRGDGLGGFLSPIAHPVFGAAFRIEDFDGDAIVDLVANGTGGLGFARGLGDGTFAPMVAFAAPDGQYSWIDAEDLDADGDLDVVGMTGFGAFVRVFLGDGHGVFQALESGFSTGGLLANRAALADLDRDGFADLVSVGASSSVRHGLGDGTFGAPVALSAQSSWVSLGDLDRDGRLDVVRPSLQGLEVAPGGQAPESRVSLSQPADVVVIADLDVDGDLDLLAAGLDLVQIRRGTDGVTAGLAAFGIGTPSCDGGIGLSGAARPALGTADFAVVATNVPRGARGVLALGTPVQNGWDPLGIGLVLHVGFALPVAFADADGFGSARFALPIPNRSFLAGLRFTAQALFAEDAANGLACSFASVPLASSRALSITLQR